MRDLRSAEEDQARAGIYALLARLLGAPAKRSLLETLADIEVESDPKTDVAVALSMLRLAAQDAREAQLDDEYHALFIGVGRGELVPFGSWYLTGFMMERPLSELRQDLSALGFERVAGNSDPEDHAAFLCEVMGILATSDAVAMADEQRFYEAHVASWMPTFFKDLENCEAACFYKAVGRLGTAFLSLEHTYRSMAAS